MEDDGFEEGIAEAKRIAVDMGTVMLLNTDSSRVAIHAAAIVFAGITRQSGVSMHMAIDVFMGIYKAMEKSNEAHE